MPKNIQLIKRSTEFVAGIQSYKLIVETANPQDMPGKIFVKQRIRNFAQDKFDDTFVAVCTPVQLEDFTEDAPEEGSSYYRTDKIELIARTPEMLQSTFESLLYETKKLVLDLNDLDILSQTTVYNVQSGTFADSLPVFITGAINYVNFTIVRGSAWSQTIVWRSGEPPIPVDMTGYTGAMLMQHEAQPDPLEVELSTENNRLTLGADGSVVMSLTQTAVNQVIPGMYMYRLEVVSPENTTTRLLGGYITVTN